VRRDLLDRGNGLIISVALAPGNAGAGAAKRGEPGVQSFGISAAKPSGFVWLPPFDESVFAGPTTKAVIAAVKQVHALCSERRFEEALAVLDRPLKGGTIATLATGEIRGVVYGLRGQALYHAERFAEAADAFKQAIEMGGSHEIYYGYGLPGLLGFALLELKRFDEAAALFSQAIETAWVPPAAGRLALDNPAQALSAVYSARGFALGCLDRLDEAIEDCTRAIEIDPTRKDAEAQETLARALLGRGRHDEALEMCARAIMIDPRRARLRVLRGYILHNLGRREEAVAACEEAVAINPILGLGHAALGDTLCNVGRWAEAIEAYQRALELSDTKEEYAFVARSLSRIAKYQSADIKELTSKLEGFVESKAPEYTGDTMGDAATTTAELIALARQVPDAKRGDASDYLKSLVVDVATETTDRATATPHPDWIETRHKHGLKVLPDFIAEKFAAELGGGTMHRGLFSRYENLRRDFYGYQRSNELPAWLEAVPTEAEWNKRNPPKAVPAAEVKRVWRDAQRIRRQHQRAVDALP
jgi:tetratricopeptide (TPR) repeat protein